MFVVAKAAHFAPPELGEAWHLIAINIGLLRSRVAAFQELG